MVSTAARPVHAGPGSWRSTAAFAKKDEIDVVPTIIRACLSQEEMKDILARTDSLGCNARPVSRQHVQRLADQITAGLWGDSNPDPVSLCFHGACLNGRHRLSAHVQADLPMDCWVAVNVPHSQFINMDCAKMRNTTDILGINGVQNNRAGVAAAVRLVGQYLYRPEVPWPLWRAMYVPRATFQDWFLKNPDCVNHSSNGHRSRGHLRSSWGAACAISYLLTEKVADHGAVEAFFDGLISGANLPNNDPRLMFRHKLAQEWRLPPAQQLGMFIKTWNLWATGLLVGGPGRTVTLSISERMPTIKQYARVQKIAVSRA